MINNSLPLHSTSQGFARTKELAAHIDVRLLGHEPKVSTKFYTLSSDPSCDHEECGLYFVAGIDAGKKFAEIEFKKDFLPRVLRPSRKVAFLDRDGILIEDTHYPGKIEDVNFLAEVEPLLQVLKDQGHEFIVVTNQSGIARDKYTVDDFKQTTRYIEDHYRKKGFPILETYYCPYHVDAVLDEYRKDSVYRKPMPGMHLAATEKYAIDLSQSIMIGDRSSDKVWLSALRCITVGQTDKNSDFKSFADLAHFLKENQ